MTFPFKDVLGYQLQVFGVQICMHVLYRCSLQSVKSRCHVRLHLVVLALKKAFLTKMP